MRSGGHAGAVLQSRRQRPTATGDHRCWRRGRTSTATTVSASLSICIGACCIGRRRAHRTPVTAGSFGPRSTRPGASARHRDDIELLWKDLPEPIDVHLLGDGATLVWTDRGDEPEGNTLNRAMVVPTIAPRSSPPIPGGDRAGRGLRRSSTSPISLAASATSTSTAALTPNWCTSATASPASRSPNCEQRKCLIISGCWCGRS